MDTNSVSIENLSTCDGQSVNVQGWLYNKRGSRGLYFLLLRDGSGLVQCVVNQADVKKAVWDVAEQSDDNLDIYEADIGLSVFGADWSAFDAFEIAVANNNENIWGFNVILTDGNGRTATSGIIQLDPDNMFSTFSVNLLAGVFDRSSIGAVTVRVSNLLPNNINDRTAEYTVRTSVPEPISISLLGLALVGVGLIRRKTV